MPYSKTTKRMLCNKPGEGQSLKPEEYLENHADQSRKNVVLGIRIENHSRLNLLSLSKHPSEYNRIFDKITNIDPFSEYLFVTDNLNTAYRGVYGSISWKLMLGSESFRFVLTYYEPYA